MNPLGRFGTSLNYFLWEKMLQNEMCEECKEEVKAMSLKDGDKVKCLGCGTELTYVKRFEGLPCNKYCCGKCCPYAKVSPCPKEKREGGITEALLQLQTGKE